MISMKVSVPFEAEGLYILGCFGRVLHHRSEVYQNIECFKVLKALFLSFEEET